MTMHLGVKSDPIENRYSYEWLFDLMGSEFVPVKNDSRRWFLPEVGRDRKMNSRRHQIADAMNCHCGLMRYHGELA